MTALQSSTSSLFIAPGVYAAFWGVVSVVAHVFILKLYPDIDKSLGDNSRQR
jgi:hypothetical protein